MNKKYIRHAELGIDGNCGFALSGEDIQSGEAEFVEIEKPINNLDHQLAASKIALIRLRKRLNIPDLRWYYGDSHPYGS